jgi:hypothetical protein
MTITVGMIGSQRGPAINPLLIFMSAIPVNSGTAEVRKNAASDPPVHATASRNGVAGPSSSS